MPLRLKKGERLRSDIAEVYTGFIELVEPPTCLHGRTLFHIGLPIEILIRPISVEGEMSLSRF